MEKKLTMGVTLCSLALSVQAMGATTRDLVAEQWPALLLQTLQAETQQLRKAAESSQPVGPVGNLVAIAERRKTAMKALMERAPAVARQFALPAEERNRLPGAVQELVEESVVLEGTLEVLAWVDDDSSRAGEWYYLEDDPAQMQLFVDRLPPQAENGSRLRVEGMLLGDRLASTETGITVVSPSSLSNESRNRVANGIDDRRALVINVNFPSIPTEPWTIESATNVFHNQVTPYYTEVSYGNFRFLADVIGWFTIDASTTACETGAYRQGAEAAARAAGYEPNDYIHVVIAFPRITACGFSGLAQQPGRYTWLNNTMNVGAATHELGHNLGLSHSHSLLCSDGPFSGDCTSTEYGDLFDVMGNGATVFGDTVSYHGLYKYYLGWIPASDVVWLTEADVGADVTINSLESTAGPRVLYVERPGANEYYTLDMREPIGVDAPLTRFPALQTGVAFYWGRSRQILREQWVNGNPTAATGPLQLGDTFFDPGSSLSITVLAVGDGQATMNVSYAP